MFTEDDSWAPIERHHTVFSFAHDNWQTVAARWIMTLDGA
jgi:hypothetical protein